jgi:hypothetical protein
LGREAIWFLAPCVGARRTAALTLEPVLILRFTPPVTCSIAFKSSSVIFIFLPHIVEAMISAFTSIYDFRKKMAVIPQKMGKKFLQGMS